MLDEKDQQTRREQKLEAKTEAKRQQTGNGTIRTKGKDRTNGSKQKSKRNYNVGQCLQIQRCIRTMEKIITRQSISASQGNVLKTPMENHRERVTDTGLSVYSVFNDKAKKFSGGKGAYQWNTIKMVAELLEKRQQNGNKKGSKKETEPHEQNVKIGLID